MRHFYFRFILGVVFVICAIYSFITVNILFALMYVVLSGVFLYSACKSCGCGAVSVLCQRL